MVWLGQQRCPAHKGSQLSAREDTLLLRFKRARRLMAEVINTAWQLHTSRCVLESWRLTQTYGDWSRRRRKLYGERCMRTQKSVGQVAAHSSRRSEMHSPRRV